jgi:hypothetical protein
MAQINMKLSDGSDAMLETTDPDADIERFVNREGPFAHEWIKVQEGGRRVRYVRYEQIVQVWTLVDV